MTLSGRRVPKLELSRPPRLGFGCAALVGGRTRRQARALLDAAWDAGIRHFDVARLYGSGDAEAVLGSFAAEHRHDITIATKFGIEPRAAAAPAAAKVVARAVLRRSRRALRFARRHSGLTTSRGEFTPDAARRSISASLSQLRTDYVDVLFMHDCSPGDWANKPTREVLDELQGDGKILTYGTATSADATREILRGPDLPAVAQFDWSALREGVETVGIDPCVTPITYSVLSGALPVLVKALADDERRRSWSQALGLELRSREEIAGLLLAHAIRANPRGIVLFSSGDPDRIAQGARIAVEAPYVEDQLQRFDLLIGQLAGPPGSA
jgi:D-threo-aldose 1-dehydrogenase